MLWRICYIKRRYNSTVQSLLTNAHIVASILVLTVGGSILAKDLCYSCFDAMLPMDQCKMRHLSQCEVTIAPQHHRLISSSIDTQTRPRQDPIH